MTELSDIVAEIREEIVKLVGVSTNLEDIAARLENMEPELPPSNGASWQKGNFTPVLKLQSASEQPSGGLLAGRYAISDGLVIVSYLLVWQPGFTLGIPSGAGTSRYYFELPPEVPDISDNIAEHGSVRMFDGKDEFSGVPSLYNAIPGAVIAEVAGQRWGVSTPFPLTKNTQYISLGIFWIP